MQYLKNKAAPVVHAKEHIPENVSKAQINGIKKDK